MANVKRKGGNSLQIIVLLICLILKENQKTSFPFPGLNG